MLIVCLTGCASQTKRTDPDGTVTYHTAEVMHDSDFSAQWQGSGSYTRTTQAKDGSVITDSISTTDGIASVRSKPQGTKAISLWNAGKLLSQGIGTVGDLGSDALSTAQ